MWRSAVYDFLILRLTARWYAEVLASLPEGAGVLDVGIGTAGALLANADLVRRKRLRVTGIDIDADYVHRARRRLHGTPLADQVQVHLESVYDHCGGPYAAIYFSGSFMLLPEPEGRCATVARCSSRKAGSTSPRPCSSALHPPWSGSSPCSSG
ncbi:SAM-dependent methyltransferase [Halomonas sp. E19]|uniref:SAM-dependent methyltransferase n=1 Tax=Halomonas sp. E19 TaxID=3397247 RepID=UPI0040341B64